MSVTTEARARDRIARETLAYIEHAKRWYAGLDSFDLAGELPDPTRAAVHCVDVVVGFCQEGALASERVNRIVEPIRRLFLLAHAHGVRHFLLPQDTHAPDAAEFAAWPPHCVRGTRESQTVDGLRSLPFAKDFVVFEKNSLHPAHGTRFDAWLDAHPELTTHVVTGDCTDLCVYTLAMHLRLRANAANRKEIRVVVPAECVDTYHLAVEDAEAKGLVAHPGDFFHLVFLHHLHLNGVEVVRAVA